MDDPRQIDPKRLASLCRRWKIAELAVFGSVLREDFHPGSDIDILVTFAPGARWGLFDLTHLQKELEDLFGRSIDLVSRRGLESSRNELRREAILSTSKVLYAA